MNQPPLPQGLSDAADPCIAPPPLNLKERLCRGATLKDLEPDFVFLQHGLLPFFGLDPLPIHWAEAGLPEKDAPCKLYLGQPVFLDLPGWWSECLFVVKKECWDDLAKFLDKVTLSRRDNGTLYNAIRQQIDIVDFLYVKKHTAGGAVPIVPVQLIGLDGNKNCFSWVPSGNPVTALRTRRDTPRPETVRLAQALFTGSDDPFAEVQKPPA